MEKHLFTRFSQNDRLLLFTAMVLMMAHPVRAIGENYTDKLMRAPLFPQQQLIWVGPTPPSEAESKELWDAFDVGRAKYLSKDLSGIESFIKTDPHSPWVPSLLANLGSFDRENGYFTLALNDWQTAWNDTAALTDARGREVADFALVNRLHLLASLGRTKELKKLFDETRNRRISYRFQDLYQESQRDYNVMLHDPEISYRCGTYALDAVAQALCGTNYFRQIWERSSPPTGFSMADLLAISDTNHLDMVAVERLGGDKLVVPSVVHWKQNHYAAIVAQRGDSYKVIDPTFQMSRWLKTDAINAECSGQFLVSTKQIPAGWRILSQPEAARIFGKGFGVTTGPPPCCPTGTCPNCKGPGSMGPGGSSGGPGGGSGGSGGKGLIGGSGNGGCGSPTCYHGMPTWTVLEPWCTVWLTDEPLAYQPSKGPEISFRLFYWSQGFGYWPDNDPESPYYFGLGYNWTCSWISFIVPDGSSPPDSVTLFAPGGGVRTYTNFDGTVPDYSTSTRMFTDTDSGGDVIRYRIVYPSGAQDIYEQPTNYEGTLFYMTQQIDQYGDTTTFEYTTNTIFGDGGVDLQYVIDSDGRTNTLSYTEVTGGEVPHIAISQITDPFGHTVTFSYDETNGLYDGYYGVGNLTNIIDTSGISSSFGYDDSTGENTSSALTSLTTPYGTTLFDETNFNGDSLTIITEPNNAHQMFYFKSYDAGWPQNYLAAIPATYTSPLYVPTNRPSDIPGGGNTLDNPDWNNPGTNNPHGDYMQVVNSFYWGREQFANLSASFRSTGPNWDLNQMTTNDFLLPRLRHWNWTQSYSVQNTLSMEREPSPDIGFTPGEMTWYDYPNKPDYEFQGSADVPILTIKVLPDGTERYQLNQLDQWNNVTNEITTYSVNGTVLTRTNSYVYAANGQDLLKQIRADGVTNAMYGYDSNHQVLFMTNALGEVTSYLYNGHEQPTSITQPNGQVTTNIYGTDGFPAEKILVSISTNYYTWTNDLEYTHTDERGLTVTNSWDALNRLTNVLYPDGTSMSYIYRNLDLVETIDRMGNKTFYTYDQIREKISMTDPRGNTTSYGYCECGALYSITDALNNVTYFIHDNQGNLLQTIYPDGYSITNFYNLLHQLVSSTDSSEMTMNNWYNNQGILIVSSNNVGLVRGLAYDIDDRVTNSTDVNNVIVVTAYDNLNRLFMRRYPDGGVEGYGYTPNISGPTSYTNQIGKVWLYGYDSLIRKTNEVCVGVTTNSFAYNGASDLLRLTDGNGNTTTWGYDQYGRVTNKLDPKGITNFVYQYDDDNRLTNRWTPAKATTIYGYDPAGNLTSVKYASPPSISLSYDGDNRLTSMVDGIGTTTYTYDQVGQLSSERGLWPDDTVNYTYQNRLRMTLSLAHPSGSPWTEDFGYDDARRLIGVRSSAGEFDYTYDPIKLQRVDDLSLPNAAYITNTFDSLARLLSTALVSSNGVDLDSQNYVYNTASQRTSETNAAGDNRHYTYDNEGELKKSLAYEPNGATRQMDEALYDYDAAGNMTSKEIGFNVNQSVHYTLNNLNQITNALMGGSAGFDGWGISNMVSGSTTSPATNVLVSGVPAALNADNSFYATLGITNGPNTYTATAWDIYGNISSNSSTVYAIPTNDAYAYDPNGNMLSDGYKTFAYDDENELIGVWVSDAWSNSFAYDGKMRQRIERDYSWDAGTSGWVETNEVHFIYDGNVVVEERNANNIPLVSYTRGNDLSGTLQKNAGIGGLLARTTYGQELPGAPTTAFYHADGNGNITGLMYPDQQLAAKYIYDPFGNPLAMSGPLGGPNRYRFSSKEWEESAGLCYFGYRFYNPSLQRWLNRDPKEELGFQSLANATQTPQLGPTIIVSSEDWIDRLLFGIDSDSIDLYRFVANDPNSVIDPFGLGRIGKALHCLWCANNLRKAYKQADQECASKKKCYEDYINNGDGNDADFDPDKANQLRKAYSDCYLAALKKAASKDCLECVTSP